MRSKVLTDVLAKYDITPCNDSSCMFGSAGGMTTNGGCRCIERTSVDRVPMGTGLYIRKLAAALRDLAAMRTEER